MFGLLDRRPAERVPCGAVGGVGLGLPTGRGGPAQGVGVVGVAAQFAVARDETGPALPVGAGRVVLRRDGAKRLDHPRRRLRGGVAAELGGALIRGLGEGGEVGVPGAAVGARHPLAPGRPERVEAAGVVVGDPRDEHAGGVAGYVRRSSADPYPRYFRTPSWRLSRWRPRWPEPSTNGRPAARPAGRP